MQQAGGDSLVPRLRFAYGTLGGFLGGQAISNFSDADADTESMEFGGAMGSTGGLAHPAGALHHCRSVGQRLLGVGGTADQSVRNAGRHLIFGLERGGLPGGPGTGTIRPTCNGVPCTGAGTAVNGNIGKAIAPNLTFASYWAQPWGHVDFAGVLDPHAVQ